MVALVGLVTNESRRMAGSALAAWVLSYLLSMFAVGVSKLDWLLWGRKSLKPGKGSANVNSKNAKSRMPLKATHGKNGRPELPAVWDHIAYSPLAIFFMDPNEPRLVTQIAIACMVSDADLRDN